MPRSGRALLTCLLALVAGALPAAAARAEVVEAPVGLASAASGITAGADGNVYVVETYNHSLAVLSPSGALIRRVALPGGGGGAATTATLGPDHRVWVAISSHDASRGFVRVASDGGVSVLPTAQACGPVGAAVFNATRMLYTTPDPAAACGADHGLGGLDADGGSPQSVAAGYSAYDVAVTGGKAYVPDYDGNLVRRYAIGAGGTWGAVEATYAIPIASGAEGIEVGPGGLLYITMYNSGDVARLEPAAPNGASAALVASGLVSPYGMAMGSDGALYVASKDARVLRIAPDGSQRLITLPANFAASQVAAVGKDVWVSDGDNARAIRIRNAGLPEPTPPATSPPAPPVAPPATTTPPTTTSPPKRPTVTALLSLASTTKCVSKRRLTITVRKRKPGEAKVASVKVTVGKGKAKTYGAKRLKVPVALTGLPKGTFKLRLTVRLTDGSTVKQTRTYKTCAAKTKTKHKG